MRTSKVKSRLVARGFRQREGIDFGETFAPTVSSSCVRLLSAIACELDLDVCRFDVEQAFVQSKLDEDVFLRLPRGCGRLSGKVVRLNKSLYWLKQASRSWHAHLTTCLNTLGFQQCLADACVFCLLEEGRIAIIAVVHVDDIFAVGLKSRCDVFRDELNRMVPVTKHTTPTFQAYGKYVIDMHNRDDCYTPLLNQTEDAYIR